MKTWTKRLAVSAGALALAVGFAGASVFADGPTDPSTPATPDSSDPATVPTTTPSPEDAAKATSDIRFTKTLVTPDAKVLTELPKLTFNFTFGEGKFFPYTSTGVDSNPSTDVTAPAINPQSISFELADVANGTAAGDGTSAVTKQSFNVIAGVTWTTPGKYVYQAKETDKTNDLDAIAPEKDAVSYDAKAYTVTVWVTYDANGNLTATGGVTEPGKDPAKPDDVIKDTSTPVDPDKQKDPTKDKDKENVIVPTPGEGTFNFKNIYTVTKTNVPGDKDTGKEAPFWMNKTVEGKLGDINKEFSFTVNITKSPLTAEKYMMYVKEAKGAAIDSKTIEVTPGEDATVILKHGDVAYFTDITVGEQITITEKTYDEYVQSNKATFDGVEQAANVDVTATGVFGTKENNVQYLNKIDADVTPTGILMNNLPYLALIVAGVAGLGFYFVNKRRHNA